MQTWPVLAQTILDAGVSSGVTVARSYIAPGPDFARDCRSIVVHLEAPQTRPFQGDFGFEACASLSQLVFRLTFVADCVPGADDNGKVPSADEITDWSTEFLADANAIYDQLVDMCAGNELCDDCTGSRLGDGVPTGPQGQVATMSWPITVANV